MVRPASLHPTRRRGLTALVACLVLAATALVTGSAGAQAAPRTPAHHHPGGMSYAPSYLALGDSVTFGYREAANLPTPDYTDAASFVGYPEDVGAALGLQVANPACPGETSTSFVTPGAPSNGCENSPGATPGYRQAYPLHVSYSGTQLQYAVDYLRHHPNTRVVSLMIGANDGFLCQETTSDQCASELPGVLAQIGKNVSTILKAVRAQAGYRGRIVILTYYSLNYADATQVASSEALNAAMVDAATPYRVTVADGYGSFEAAAAQAGGNSCTAGLLTQLTTGGCGVHPSVAGQALLALAVEKAIRAR